MSPESLSTAKAPASETLSAIQAALDADPALKCWRYIAWDHRCNSIAGVYNDESLAAQEFEVATSAFPDRYEIIDQWAERRDS